MQQTSYQSGYIDPYTSLRNEKILTPRPQPLAVVTGASGFIGGHLLKSLRKGGVDATILPRSLLYNKNKLEKYLTMIAPDYIYHLAAYGNMANQKDAKTIFEANTITTFNLLSATKNISYNAFINFGSSSEYGVKTRLMSESDLPEGDTFYAATKIAGTYLCKAFATNFHKPIVTVRPFTVYGPQEAEFRLVPTAIRAALTQETIPFVSYPEHDWIYIEDFLSGVSTVVDNIKMLKGQVVNIGTGIATTNGELIKTLSQTTEKGIRTDEGAYKERPHHSPTWQADITLLKSLGWAPKFTLSAGLLKTYEYYKGEYEK